MGTAELRAARRLISETVPEPVQDWLKRRIGARAMVSTADSVPVALGDSAIVHPRTPQEIDFFRSRALFSIEKARRVLGYQPAFDLDAGMAPTGDWARRVALVP